MAQNEEQTPTADEQLLRQVFEFFDKDKNGKICECELITVLQCVGKNPSNKEMEELLTEYDKDGNGFLDFEEFVNMLRNIRGKGKEKLEQELEEAFRFFDKNGDGRISSSELQHVMMNCGETFTKEEAESFISYFDENKDGFLDWREFVVFYNRSTKEFVESFRKGQR